MRRPTRLGVLEHPNALSRDFTPPLAIPLAVVMKYTAVIEKTPTGYSAYLPDIPGCVAAADTRAETEALIQEAAAYHLEMLRENGDPTPQPQTSAAFVEA